MVSIRDEQEMNAVVNHIRDVSDTCKVWLALRRLVSLWKPPFGPQVSPGLLVLTASLLCRVHTGDGLMGVDTSIKPQVFSPMMVTLPLTV